DLDVLVCATGFHTTSPPPFPVIGRNGLTLAERWRPFPETYLSVSVDGFPNHFMMLGFNGGTGSGSLTSILEAQGDYIVKCLRKIQKERYLTMEPKIKLVKDFSVFIQTYFQNTVYMDSCKSWYCSTVDGTSRVTALWPGTPRWEDFIYERVDENAFSWFGNGSSMTNSVELGDPAWYLEPSQVSKP
ncbi:hypothetical protein DL98DRAFT_388248, partial [Cadophora sp. DSE1049]